MVNINRIEKFFTEDVQNTIPAIIKEWIELSGLDKNDTAKIIKEASIREGEHASNSCLDYYLMSEPYLHVTLDFKNNIFSSEIYTQVYSNHKFIAYTFEEFRDYWNKLIAESYGQDVHFPLMPKF